MQEIHPQQLQPHIAESKLDLIDVRTPAEYETVHIQGARTAPLQELNPDQIRSTRPPGAEGPTYVLCKSGGRAKQACERLAAAGLDVTLVVGGTDACLAAGLPAVRGRQTMSLERQVRIAAGALVALGTAAAWLTQSFWPLLVPGFVGCGLVFAGMTDTCGMGMLLARMPWNRRA